MSTTEIPRSEPEVVLDLLIALESIGERRQVLDLLRGLRARGRFRGEAELFLSALAALARPADATTCACCGRGTPCS